MTISFNDRTQVNNDPPILVGAVKILFGHGSKEIDFLNRSEFEQFYYEYPLVGENTNKPSSVYK